MILGKRLYASHNSTFRLGHRSWGAPVANVALPTGGTADLGDILMGDFFNLSKGLGTDGKIEFTATCRNGMAMTFKAKVYGGDMSYRGGTDAASVCITGVVSYNVSIDAGAQALFMPE